MNQSTDNSRCFEVRLVSYKVVGWLGIVFGALCSVGAFLARQYGPIWVFGFFIGLGIYTILGAGRFVFDQEGVTHQTVLRMYRIHWNEVKRVEIGAADGTVVLHGENKRFVLAPPSAWSGPQKFDAYSFFSKKVRDSGIVPYTSRIAAYKIHNNVRVDANSAAAHEPA
jgi:hypothetical protein